MSKIRSLGDIAKKEERRKRASGIFIISLLLLSTIGFALSMVNFGSQNVQEQVQGFSNNGQYWIYTVGDQQYFFTHHIEEVNTSSYSLNKTILDFTGRQVYVDSQLPGGLQEVYSSLGPYLGRLNEACYGSCDRDLPELNCLGDPLIVIRENDISSITEQQNCVFVNGDMKTLDAFLYKVLGIAS